MNVDIFHLQHMTRTFASTQYTLASGIIEIRTKFPKLRKCRVDMVKIISNYVIDCAEYVDPCAISVQINDTECNYNRLPL